MKNDWEKNWEVMQADIKRREPELKRLYSMALVTIPQPEIVEVEDWRRWVLGVEEDWRESVGSYIHSSDFNTENGIGGKFGQFAFEHCKLYRLDGTNGSTWRADDFRHKRAYWVRDHHENLRDVHKVQVIADHLAEFLKARNIKHERINFEDKTLKQILVYSNI